MAVLCGLYLSSCAKDEEVAKATDGGKVPVRLTLAFSNFVASLNLEVRNRCGIDQQSKFAPFLLQSQFQKTFLTFPDVEVFLTVFLHQYLSALKLPEIHLM